MSEPRLTHSARQMFETRWAKYNDPQNEEWVFDDDMAHANKWERHAWSSYLDLKAAEAEAADQKAKQKSLATAVDELKAEIRQREACFAEDMEGMEKTVDELVAALQLCLLRMRELAANELEEVPDDWDEAINQADAVLIKTDPLYAELDRKLKEARALAAHRGKREQ